MLLIPVKGIPKLHSTPLASVYFSGDGSVYVEVDDENRMRIVFSTYQASKITTSDCFRLPNDKKIIPETVSEIVDSIWVSELREVLSLTDESATFLDKGKHFLVPAQDDFIEIVTYD